MYVRFSDGNGRDTPPPIKSEQFEEDEEVECLDGPIGQQDWYVPVQIIQPPEFDDQMRQSNEDILNDLNNQVGVEYTAPPQMLQIALKFEEARQRDARRNPLRDHEKLEAKRPKKRYAWSTEQDQQIVAMALYHIFAGKDMTTIQPYKDMKNASPLFRLIEDPRQIRRRLLTLCSPNNSTDLENFCGRSAAQNDQERKMAENVAKTITASCVDLRLVKEWGLEEFTRRKVLSTPFTNRQRPPPPPTNADPDVQVVQVLAITAPSTSGSKRSNPNAVSGGTKRAKK